MKIIFTSNSLIFYNVIEMIHIYPTYIHSKNLTPYFYSFHWKVCFNWVLFLKYTDRPMKLLSLQIFWLWHNTKSFCWFCGQYLRGRYTMQNYHCNFFFIDQCNWQTYCILKQHHFGDVSVGHLRSFAKPVLLCEILGTPIYLLQWHNIYR